MIGFVLVCVGFLVVLALVVGVRDMANASSLRALAAERRERWEARRGLVPAPLGRPSRARGRLRLG